jgi:cytidine kinase
MYYTIGGFTLDDTILPDGEIRWAAPGGNALYSAIGARLWGGDVGIIAPVGRDYPQAYLDRLRGASFDTAGIRRIDHPSYHVWVLHEGDGRRQIVYRLDSGVNAVLDPGAEDLPAAIFRAQGALICPILGASQAALMERLLAGGVPVFLDLIVIPGQIDVRADHRPDLWPRLRGFLPSLEEVRALFGDLPLPGLIENLLAAGLESFAVKMGRRGCLVHDPRDREIYHVPAYPTRAVDATGAGDAFCGGFMVGLQETGDPIEAALRGTVSASFVIEDFGALHAMQVSPEMAQERLASLRAKVQRFSRSEKALSQSSTTTR